MEKVVLNSTLEYSFFKKIFQYVIWQQAMVATAYFSGCPTLSLR